MNLQSMKAKIVIRKRQGTSAMRLFLIASHSNVHESFQHIINRRLIRGKIKGWKNMKFL